VPVVTIKLARREEPTTPEQKAALISGITQLLQDILAKRPEDVVVLIEELDSDNWGQGGQTATALRQKRRRAKV
jgi:4-oxalocrotonate tautomerase